MSKADIERVTPEVAGPIDERIEAIRALFPEVCTEGKIDFDALRLALGDEIDDSKERYSFTWAGKRDSARMLQIPTRATLRPVPEESVDFENTGNVFIEGDNLEALKLLYKSYFGRVKMIYIDPPYNTGHDFVYPDNYTDPLETYLQLTRQMDEEGNRTSISVQSENSDRSGRYHSAWLSMMFPRLFLARQLLREDGVIFVSIDDHELHNLRMLMNEVFGEENFVVGIAWKKATGANDTEFAYVHENVLVYRKSPVCEIGRLPRSETQLRLYSNPDSDPRGNWASADYSSKYTPEERPTLHYPVVNPFTGKKVWPKKGQTWRCSKETHDRNEKDNRVWWGLKGELAVPRYKRFLSDVSDGVIPRSLWDNVGTNEAGKNEFLSLGFYPGDFNNPKPTGLIGQMLRLGSDSEQGDIILDFFAGSCTTAQAILGLNRQEGANRRFIMVQLPEPAGNEQFSTIAEIGKERIRRVIAKLKEEAEGKLDISDRDEPEDLGFRVFKLSESNFRPWMGVDEATGESYAEQMALYADPLVDGWKPESVLWEAAIKEGYSLSSLVERITGIDGNTVFRVTDPDKEQSLRICLDDDLKPETVRTLKLGTDDLFICRDVALTDELAANLALQCKVKTI